MDGMKAGRQVGWTEYGKDGKKEARINRRKAGRMEG